MNEQDIKKFLLSLLLYKEKFYKYTIYNDKIYKINLNNDYNEVKDIYNEILKNKVFDEEFEEYISKFKRFVIEIEFYKVFLIEYEIIFILDDFVDDDIIIFTEA